MYHAWRLLDRKIFGRAHLVFLADWFQRERCEALLFVSTKCHALSHGDVRYGECQESGNLRVAMVIFVLVATEIWLRDLGLIAATVGAGRQHRGSYQSYLASYLAG